MTRKVFPTLLSAMLIGCLAIGTLANLTDYTGIAVLIVAGLICMSTQLLANRINTLKFTHFRLVIGIGLLAMLASLVTRSLKPSSWFKPTTIN